MSEVITDPKETIGERPFESFDRRSVEARETLFYGTHPKLGADRIYRAVRVVSNSQGGEEVLFRELAPGDIQVPPFLTKWLAVTRAYSFTATMTPLMGVFLAGWSLGYPFLPLSGWTAIFGVLCLHIAINIYNDVEDYMKLIDLPGTPGGSGVIEKGWYSPSELKAIAGRFLVLGLLLGVPTLLLEPQSMLIVGVVSLLGVLGYSHRFLGFKYRGLGDLSVFLMCGPLLTLGFGVAAFGLWAWPFLYLGIFFGAMACTILHVNNMHDIEIDQSRGASTLAVKFGFLRSRWLLVGFYALAFAALGAGVLQGYLPMSSFLALLSLGLIGSLVLKFFKASGPSSPHLGPTRFHSAQIHLLGGVLLCVGLIVGRWL